MVSDQERYEALAMAAVDGMLTANEREELARLGAQPNWLISMPSRRRQTP